MTLKDPNAARGSLNRALEVSPKFVLAQRALITLELIAGRPEQALAVARAVQSERPDQNIGYLLAGDVEASRKNWEAAATAYRFGIKREGGSTELAVKLHSVLDSAQKRPEAGAFASAWIKEHPQDAAFRTYLGDRALAQVDLTGAESEYLAVVKLQPENAVALNNLAWVANRLKRPGALAYAERAIALRPEEPSFMDTLAVVLGDTGQASKAVALEKRAIALAPDRQAFRLNLAKLYLKVGDKGLAKTELDQLAKLGDKFTGQAEVAQLLNSL